MSRKNYEKAMNFFRKNTAAFTALKIVYKYLPLVIFASYPVMLICEWIFMREAFLKILCVPAGVFLLVTILRRLINEQRPYEKYGVPSLFGKTTKGKSMPSRHTASAFIISMAILYLNFCIGIIFLVISALIAASRILSGVHFVRDVAVGAAISVLCGIVFFFMI